MQLIVFDAMQLIVFDAMHLEFCVALSLTHDVNLIEKTIFP